MANVVYPRYRYHVQRAELNLQTVPLRAYLIDLGAYAYSASHDSINDVPLGARVATSANLTPTVSVAGAVDVADFVFSAVTGPTYEALIVFAHTGTAATSYLVAFYDSGVAGIPGTPNGSNVSVTVDPAGLFTF